jgi:hypothetical protein
MRSVHRIAYRRIRGSAKQPRPVVTASTPIRLNAAANRMRTRRSAATAADMRPSPREDRRAFTGNFCRNETNAKGSQRCRALANYRQEPLWLSVARQLNCCNRVRRCAASFVSIFRSAGPGLNLGIRFSTARRAFAALSMSRRSFIGSRVLLAMSRKHLLISSSLRRKSTPKRCAAPRFPVTSKWRSRRRAIWSFADIGSNQLILAERPLTACRLSLVPAVGNG